MKNDGCTNLSIVLYFCLIDSNRVDRTQQMTHIANLI